MGGGDDSVRGFSLSTFRSFRFLEGKVHSSSPELLSLKFMAIETIFFWGGELHRRWKSNISGAHVPCCVVLQYLFKHLNCTTDVSFITEVNKNLCSACHVRINPTPTLFFSYGKSLKRFES
jgi:hypothetical protein